MVCNRSKTELVLFNQWGELEISIPDLGIESKSSMKIVGIQFNYNLAWKDHIDRVVAKVNSLTYALR